MGYGNYRDDVNRGLREAGWGVRRAAWWVIGLMITLIPIGIIGTSMGWFSEAISVAREEFGPRELLRKYEWFKDAAAQLDKRAADIVVFEGRLKSIREAYKDTPRKDWPRDDRENERIWLQEVSGVKAAYNSLAAEYNAGMAKLNWKLCNVGDLPRGATVALPREYRAYVTE